MAEAPSNIGPFLDQTCRAIDKMLLKGQRAPLIGLIVPQDFESCILEVLSARSSLLYAAIPHLDCRGEGLKGRLWMGTIEGIPVLVGVGRARLWETSAWQSVQLHRALLQLGCTRILLFSRAARLGTQERHQPDQIAIIRGHNILYLRNLHYYTPSEPRSEMRVEDVYDSTFRSITWTVAESLGEHLLYDGDRILAHPDGILLQVQGPGLGPREQIEVYRDQRANLAGVDLAHEADAIYQAGGRVGGLCIITDPYTPRTRRSHRTKKELFNEAVLMKWMTEFFTRLFTAPPTDSDQPTLWG